MLEIHRQWLWISPAIGAAQRVSLAMKTAWLIYCATKCLSGGKYGPEAKPTFPTYYCPILSS